MYYIIGYRKEIVLNNLKIAFPEKAEEELKKISKQFYKNFADNFVEISKLLSISKKELRKRFLVQPEILHEQFRSGRNVQVHLGHFFNWEYANLAYAAEDAYPNFLVVYMPIKNKVFDKLLYKMRARFRTKLLAATNFRNEFKAFHKKRFLLVLVGDQTAGNYSNSYWTEFFGKKTPIVRGPEKGAIINNATVLMSRFYKVKRGYYASELKLLTNDPRSLPEGEITKRMIAYIEESIHKDPANYLWSHRRWKREFDEAQYGHLVI